MTYELRLRPEAEWDIEEAAHWYEAQREGLGHDFVNAVEDILDKVRAKPLAYPVVYRGSRRALIQKFPFGIHFIVVGSIISVLAVIHGSRHPRHWQSRT
ncbi:type II toxin-antitoxin system RelE/ParE family toxin [Billgrantia desiderata]|uniref:type II toxin-antitoxin system RelE/ParE family toxin n=1 Tax=Billgrantia desiderata TaxID=52021 RepID=UPI001F3F4348|nr:type II toxin-antitoxin system RelE/ParE family toxin [Halomonas desiderata]MCE8014344.1 type II toxin-antitoxin system RelE/ParE family toxin [Halomonas desiderata]